MNDPIKLSYQEFNDIISALFDATSNASTVAERARMTETKDKFTRMRNLFCDQYTHPLDIPVYTLQATLGQREV